MSKRESGVATDFTVEESAPTKGATSVMWKCFGHKRSAVQQSTIIRYQKKGSNTTHFFFFPFPEAEAHSVSQKTPTVSSKLNMFFQYFDIFSKTDKSYTF